MCIFFFKIYSNATNEKMVLKLIQKFIQNFYYSLQILNVKILKENLK